MYPHKWDPGARVIYCSVRNDSGRYDVFMYGKSRVEGERGHILHLSLLIHALMLNEGLVIHHIIP